MALLKLATMSGVEGVFTSTMLSALASSLLISAPGTASMTFWTNPGYFTRLTYDPYEDAVLVLNGQNQHPNYVFFTSTTSSGNVRQPLTTILLRGDTLHPAGSAGSGGDIQSKGASQQYFPGSGGSTGYSIDPNTNTAFQHFWHFGTNTIRGGGTNLPYGYGNIPMVSVTINMGVTASGASGPQPWGTGTWSGGIALGEQLIASGMITPAGRAGRFLFAPGLYTPALPAIILNDVAVFAYGDRGGNAWISCRARPVTAASAWRGTRSLPFGWPMALCPMGVDRVIALWWAYARYGATLVYTVFRYDRALDRLRLEDIGDVPSPYTYSYPQHVGFATYDTRRGRILLLSTNPNEFDIKTLDQFCHPGIPLQAAVPAPLDPGHAGYTQRYGTATYTAATLLAAPLVVVSYPGFSSTDTSRQTAQFATEGPTGTGTFAVSWASGASGVSGTVAIGFSTYSVGLSATYSQGVAYGTNGMALLASTATFTVSTTLSAATATSTVANVIIMPRIPVSQADAIGAGSPRLLSYPTSALATPYLYGLNPQQTTNFNAGPLTRPLYASTRTLSKTATVQFQGDFTDLEVTETWMGGGNRIAMALSQFAMLYDYFNNVPDVASAGFITWQPRDISSRSFKVFITSLTVGGTDGITLDHLVKAGTGWVHESVEMKLRLIAEV